MQHFLQMHFLLCTALMAPALLLAQDTTTTYSRKNMEVNGLRGDYFNGTNFEEHVYSKFDDVINFSYTRQSPAPGVRGEYYSIRWTGSLYAPVTGIYTLSVRVDDGIRVWLDGVKILDQWKLQETTAYTGQLELQGGKYYPLKIEYYNGPVHGVMQLLWEMPDEAYNLFSFFRNEKTRRSIPKQYLFRKTPEKEPPTAIAGIKRQSVADTINTPPEKTVTIAKPHQQVKQQEQLRTVQDISQPEPMVNIPAVAPEHPADDVYSNLKPGDRLPLHHVFFEQGKYILLEGSSLTLDKLARTMVVHPNMRIRIEGHTDNVGDPNINQSLSEYRAKAVATYLNEHGVDLRRIEVKGYGSSMPLTDNNKEEGRSKNRRVEFVVK